MAEIRSRLMFIMFDSNKAMCVAPLTGFFPDASIGNMETLVPTTTSELDRAVAEQTLQRLALGLTPGLGPTRARRLVEHFGNVTAVFRASLTELEATGLLAVSAQSLGTGKSMELAQEEMGRSNSARSTIHRWRSTSAATGMFSRTQGSPSSVLLIRRLMARAWQSGSLPTDSPSLSDMARGVDTAAQRGAMAAKG
jgi:hypothetical protein